VAFRIDIGSNLRPPKRTAAGHLRADAYLTRTGVFVYLNPDGTERREYRPDSEVFAPESLESFELLPMTNDHPATEVTPANTRELSVGSTGDTVKRDGRHVASSIAVTEAKAIADVEAGKTQLSCGYTCDLEMTPGISPDGERYDAVQRNIRGNHVAIVAAGRAGTARIRTDAATMVGPVPTFNAGAITVDLAQALEALGKEKARADAAEASRAKAEAERDAALAAQTRADKARADAESSIDARVNSRVALLAGAAKLVKDENLAKLPAMSDVEVMTTAVRDFDGEASAAKCAGQPEGYLRARFDAALEQRERADKGTADLRTNVENFKQDAGTDDLLSAEDKARRAMNARSNELGRKPLNAEVK